MKPGKNLRSTYICMHSIECVHVSSSRGENLYNKFGMGLIMVELKKKKKKSLKKFSLKGLKELKFFF